MPSEKPNGHPADGHPDKKAALAATLSRRILTMEIAPGAVVDEVALSEEFGLSRSPVRELLRQMAGEGYIELEANRPARVTSMSYESLREYYLVASTIYIMTTKLAAEKAYKADVDTAEKNTELTFVRLRRVAMLMKEYSLIMNSIFRLERLRGTII